MRKILFPAIWLTVLLTFYSCKKDEKPVTVTGNWKFLNIHAQTQSVAQYNDGVDDLKTIMYADYITENNTGSILFDGVNANISEIGYSANSAASAYFFINEAVTDSTPIPFTVNIAPFTSTSGYQIIGRDSILFSNVSMGAQTSNGASASGGRFSISGDVLTMTSRVSRDTLMDMGGVMVHNREFATATMTFQRQ